jgi:hypothetical protein
MTLAWIGSSRIPSCPRFESLFVLFLADKLESNARFSSNLEMRSACQAE